MNGLRAEKAQTDSLKNRRKSLDKEQTKMAVKKTQLYASLWASCDKLRGGMDSSEYKDYILALLIHEVCH